ncbi:unnamed protein product [Adineta ricciae]|uniref:NACHT domain-containing protein n=1 Tax=Adineta ricciae TaxID=249248 RepID=A0A815RYY7_ADIRI|nr:unnamed protein product [Adineta ricciae]
MPVWINRSENVTADSLHDSLANGVENAAAVFCFLTPDYERSPVCKLELQYAHKRRKLLIPCLFDDKVFWDDSSWLMTVVGSLHCYNINDIQDRDNMYLEDLINDLNQKRFSSKHVLTESLGPPNYLFELIKYRYLCDNKIERLMNPSETFPIDQIYINLAIVETKETQEKEKKLDNTQSIDAVMGACEQIYGSESPIDVKDVFTKCKDQNRNILVFGRAGIGKSTFCRYAAYQWATGAIWSEYELVALVPLRSLTGPKYREDKDYSLIDILINQYCSDPFWSDEQKNKLVEKLVEQIRRSKILWLLDGYDEIAQDPPRHLQILLEQLRKTPHHIITSRPYMNTLSYSVKMEITGFTDENISNYIKLFFDQLGNSSREDESLLNFLQLNPKIWGIAHIPINLELICSVWSNFNWTKTQTVTLTVLYDKLTEWICRRYLEKQKKILSTDLIFMDKNDVYEECKMELVFLERLAFLGMENNVILLSPALLRNAEEKIIKNSFDRKNLFNFGILKSYDSNIGRIGTHNEVQQDYYFVHLSFQEYFAARYLANALTNTTGNQTIEFIQQHKYNPRYQLLFAFLAGLLSETPDSEYNSIFWNTLFTEPSDITRMQHMALVIPCLDEINSNKTFIQAQQLFEMTTRWVENAITHPSRNLLSFVTSILRSCYTICNATHIQEAIVRLLDTNQTTIILRTLEFISSIPLNNPTNSLKRTVLQKLQHQDSNIKHKALQALTSMYERAATKEIIDALVNGLSDNNFDVREEAFHALDRMAKTTAAKQVIDALVNALSDNNSIMREAAFLALSRMGKNGATKEVIDGLLQALKSDGHRMRSSACEALGRMGQNEATKEVIDALVNRLSDDNPNVRRNACLALCRMGQKAATKEVIDALVNRLSDDNFDVRRSTRFALDGMAKTTAAKQVIDALVNALSDDNPIMREAASLALSRMGKNGATKEVIDGLLQALKSDDHRMRSSACEALGRMDQKAATKEVIDALVNGLSDDNFDVREEAFHALDRMAKTIAAKQVIDALVKALSDDDSNVRRHACEALGRMRETAARKEVIDALAKAPSDDDSDIVEKLGKPTFIWYDQLIPQFSTYQFLKNALSRSYWDLTYKHGVPHNCTSGGWLIVANTDIELNLSKDSIAHTNVFNDEDTCVQCIQEHTGDRMFFVAPNAAASRLIPRIFRDCPKAFQEANHQSPASIYILCSNSFETTEWTSHYEKYIQLFTYETSLLNKFMRDVEAYFLDLGERHSVYNTSASLSQSIAFLTTAKHLFTQYDKHGHAKVYSQHVQRIDSRIVEVKDQLQKISKNNNDDGIKLRLSHLEGEDPGTDSAEYVSPPSPPICDDIEACFPTSDDENIVLAAVSSITTLPCNEIITESHDNASDIRIVLIIPSHGTTNSETITSLLKNVFDEDQLAIVSQQEYSQQLDEAQISGIVFITSEGDDSILEHICSLNSKHTIYVLEGQANDPKTRQEFLTKYSRISFMSDDPDQLTINIINDIILKTRVMGARYAEKQDKARANDMYNHSLKLLNRLNDFVVNLFKQRFFQYQSLLYFMNIVYFILLHSSGRQPLLESHFGPRTTCFDDVNQCILHVNHLRQQNGTQIELFLPSANSNIVGTYLPLYGNIRFHIYCSTTDQMTQYQVQFPQRYYVEVLEDAHLWISIGRSVLDYDSLRMSRNDYPAITLVEWQRTREIIDEEIRAAQLGIQPT